VYKSILQQLVRLSRTIMASAPACFLLPDKWDKYAETLKTCSMNRENDRLQYCFESLSRRNECLQNHGSWQHKHLRNSLKQRLIQVLDTLSLEPDYGKIARTCFRITHDGDVLVNVCVEWSCSIYRHGIFRSYAAARLLRIWSRLGIELQQPVFDFLASTSSRKDLGREDLYRLLAGLVSSRHFSVGRYLQWLMARGTLRGRSKRRLVSYMFYLSQHWLIGTGLPL